MSTKPEYQKEVEKFGFMEVPVVGNGAVKGFNNEQKELMILAISKD